MEFLKNSNKYINIFISLFFILNIIIFFLTIFHLKHSIKSYTIFSLISIFYLQYSCFKFRSYTELYMSIFLYLGFWFKSSIFLIFNDYTYLQFPESPQTSNIMTDEHLNKHLSEVFNIASFSIMTIFLTFYIINNFTLLTNKKFNTCKLDGLKKFFVNNKLKLYFFYIFLSISIIFLNYIFSIAYRGKIYLGFDIIENIFKIFLFFGTLIIACIFFELEDNKKNIKKFIFFNIIQGFFISISIHSRAMIFEQLAIFFSIYRKIKKKLFGIKILLFMISFFFLSVFIVSLIRYNNSKNINSFFFVKEVFYLTTNRWVGIDGLSAVVGYKEKGLTFYFNALKEKDKSEVTYYEKNIFKKELKPDNFYKSTYVPGFIAFIYYSNSIYILIMTLIFLITILVCIERVVYFFSMNSLIITNYLALVVVWRMIHFGVYPIYTLYYYSTIIFFLFCIYFSNNLLNKYYD
jgi:hypothetical protein